MSHRNVQKMLKKYADMADKEGCAIPSVHPHLLRRSRASNLYQNGVPIEMVSRLLGHSSVETTKDHYAYPSLKQMREAMDAGSSPSEKEQPLWVGHEDELYSRAVKFTKTVVRILHQCYNVSINL